MVMRLLRTSVGVAVLCLALTATTATAQDKVDKPTLQSGEHWTYRRIDLWKNEETERFREDLLGGVGDSSTVLWTILSSQDERRRNSITYEFIDAATLAFYDPKAEGRHVPLQFPLYPGKTWSFRYTYHPQPLFDITIKQTAVVEGWENVTVPVGTFRALKVTHRGEYHATWGTFYTWSGEIHETYWYAPDAKRVVRMEYRDTQYGGSTWDFLRDELVDFKVFSGK